MSSNTQAHAATIGEWRLTHKGRREAAGLMADLDPAVVRQLAAELRQAML
jgi:hypothetical protein